MQDCLKDFEKRMKKLSYPFLIDSQVIKKTEWEKYGLNLQQMINLVYTVLCLIMESSLKDEECTYKDINNFLSGLLSKYYKINLNEEDIYDLSKYIVMRVLRNEGTMFIFEAYDYENNSTKTYQYHLVKQEYSRADTTKSTFALTEEGYRLMLNSFEVDQKLKIEIESFIAEESIKHQNYKQGLMAVRNLDNLITSQIQAIDNFTLRAKEDVLFIEADEFNESYNKNLKILGEQNVKFRSLKRMITKEKNKVIKLIEGNMEIEYMDKLYSIGDIEKGLKKIIEKATKLISKHMDFSDVYVKALEGLSYLYNNEKFDLTQKVLKPIEEDITRIDNVHNLLNCLFIPKVPKRLNLNKIFEEQKVDKKEDTLKGTEINEELFEDEDESEIKINQIKYIKIVKSILLYMNKHRDTELKTLIEDYNKRPYNEYIEMIPTIRLFTEVMIEFIRIGEINIEEFINEYHQSYTNEKIDSFDLKSTLYEVIVDEKNELSNIKRIRFLKKKNEETLEIRERLPKESSKEPIEEEKLITTITVAKCNNYILQIV